MQAWLWARHVAGKLWARTLGKLEEQYERRLNDELAQCESLLDVGCGFSSPVRSLRRRPSRVVGVDMSGPVLVESQCAGIHDEYFESDVLALDKLFDVAAFDCVLASDLIEHLTHDDGLTLLRQMERVARRKVLVYTPNGYLPQEEEYGNRLQHHLSGWTVGEMRSLGFRVAGIQGLKPLRGYMAQIRWRPTRFWLAFSLCSQPLAEIWPTLAFRILCVKDMPSNREL